MNIISSEWVSICTSLANPQTSPFRENPQLCQSVAQSSGFELHSYGYRWSQGKEGCKIKGSNTLNSQWCWSLSCENSPHNSREILLVFIKSIDCCRWLQLLLFKTSLGSAFLSSWWMFVPLNDPLQVVALLIESLILTSWSVFFYGVVSWEHKGTTKPRHL